MTPQGRMPEREIMHDDRIRALARYVCRMGSRSERKGFLGRFRALHGASMGREIEAAVKLEWKARKGTAK